MNPDVADAIGRLSERGILSEPQASPLLRAARGEIVSIHVELRALLYAGVLLATTGVGLLLKENHERLGPAVIASLLGAAAAACVLYVGRRSPPFSWQSVASPHIAVDYVLLLGVLLLGSDLAYVETQFRLFGPSWPYHLLLVSVLYLAAAYRFDSRVVLSLALTSFAAWRGVSVSLSSASRTSGSPAALRANAIACGALFVAAGILSVRLRRKPHFEAVWLTLALLLLFGAILSGVFQPSGSAWLLWEALLALLGAAVLAVSYWKRRAIYFAIGTIVVYLGVLRAIAEAIEGRVLMLIVAASSLAVIAFLIRSHRRMREPA